MAAYFVGFVIGTYVCPKIIEEVGHIRAFSVFAAIAATSVLLHALVFGAFVWAILRLLTGGCVVGLYMVTESWLNEQATNQERGRVLAAYQVTSLLSLAVGQWLLLIDASGITPLLICAALFALGLVPVALTKVPEPTPIPSAELNLSYLWVTSPLGVLGTFLVASANGVFFALGPLFAQIAGLNTGQVVLFMSLMILGGVTLQWPIGHLSDTQDRRTMILVASVAAATLAGLAGLTIGRSIPLFMLVAFLYGGFTFSLYPLCVAHANDHVRAGEFVKTASGLLLIYGIGASIGPIVMGMLLGQFGQSAFFGFLLAIHAGLSVASLLRMRAREAPGIESQEPFVMLTRTSQSALGMLPSEQKREVEDQ